MKDRLVMGIDFGTDSVRTIILNALSGEIRGQAVHKYPRWEKELYCSPGQNQFRQHPLDYIESLEISVRRALHEAGPDTGRRIEGISIDTTGSTPCAVDKEGTPLALNERFKDDPDAMFMLWKDHSAIQEAEDINDLSRTWGGTDFTVYSGGIYSPEWYWAKILHTLKHNKNVRDAAVSWVEHCDWMPFLLTGGKNVSTMVRSRCSAGHKAMWHESWDGLPSEKFLSSLSPLLSGLRGRLYSETVTADVPAGRISEYWADRLGIHPGAVVGAGALDAHIGAVGGGIAPGTMVKVMGTSTCDMIISDPRTSSGNIVKGISGQVNGSIIPGFTGYEAGQSAFGDVYAWFKKLLEWPLERASLKGSDTLLQELEKEAEKLPPRSSVTALDWFNGRRTPDGNPKVTGTITGLKLGTGAPEIYRALMEATAFGSKAILDRFTENGIHVNDIIAVGGIAKKSPLVMQILADVMNREISVLTSEQTVAAGAAICASVVCGIHRDIPAAQKAMKPVVLKKYAPIPENAVVYEKSFRRYKALGNIMENFKEG